MQITMKSKPDQLNQKTMKRMIREQLHMMHWRLVSVSASDETSWLLLLCVKKFSVSGGICFDRLT